MKGMRVQSIIRELRGEKIDIIEYSDDAVVFATHALSPAKVSKISILDATEKHMEVIVDDSQLSLAIGKKGQNVRLAAKLLGWKIDIKSEEEKRQEVESQMAALVAPGAPVSVLIEYGLAESLVGKLLEAGVGTIEKLGGMTPEQLEEIQGIGPQMVERIQESVNAYYGQFEAEAAAAEGAAAAPLSEPETSVVEARMAEPAPEQEQAQQLPGEAAAEQVETAELAPEASTEPVAEESAAFRAPAQEAAGEQFGTIEDAGSPIQKQPEGAGPEGSAEPVPEEGHGE
jgi:N utilization substance protein A